ncbi:MAG TPA: YihY/virulence factor BrkB family protein [Pseudomonadales bacterium]
MSSLRYGFRVFWLSIQNFLSDSCFRHSATLSFYTLFSLAPMALISVQVASLFAAEVDFERELVQQFTELVGPQGAQGVVVLLENLENAETTRFRLIIGAFVLMFSATNIFVQAQAAFNEIFCVKAATGRGIIKKALDRLVSLGIILSLGLIMILSLVVDSAMVLVQNWLATSFPQMTVYFIAMIQYVVLAVLGTLEIYALLHFLPDVQIPPKYKVHGCAAIVLLLVLGKGAISAYISTNQLSELGGAAASIVVLMLWIYYSSAILFFGAELIRSQAAIDEVPLLPKRYAVKVKSVVVEEANQAKVEDDEPKSHEPLPPEKDPELYEVAPSTVAAAVTGGIVSGARAPAMGIEAEVGQDPVIAGDDAIGSITADEVVENAERIDARAAPH